MQIIEVVSKNCAVNIPMNTPFFSVTNDHRPLGITKCPQFYAHICTLTSLNSKIERKAEFHEYYFNIPFCGISPFCASLLLITIGATSNMNFVQINIFTNF